MRTHLEVARRDVQSKVKLLPTSRNSNGTGTTLTNDPHLAGFAYGANVYYRLDAVLRVVPSLTGIDFKWKFVASAGVILMENTTHLSVENGGFVSNPSRSDNDTRTPIAFMLVGLVYTMHMHGKFKSSAAGTLDFQWAQNTLSGNSITLHEGSYMDLMRVGSS